jgi:hypothetical protein
VSAASKWVERRIGRKLSPEHVRCVDTSGAIAAPHNLPLAGDDWLDVEWRPKSMRIIVRADMRGLATTDADHLTGLVLRAHQNLVRVDLAPHSFHYLSIWFHARTLEGDNMVRHPSLEELADKALKLAEYQVTA